MLQVFILQEKLEEKDHEIKRLKLELELNQKTTVIEEDNKIDVAVDATKVKDEMITDEPGTGTTNE